MNPVIKFKVTLFVNFFLYRSTSFITLYKHTALTRILKVRLQHVSVQLRHLVGEQNSRLLIIFAR
jgi:hypothetical protein